ncbi:MAG TPA: TonB-dependent receptor [Flavobacteriaceae bacterium]|nr:TonB-dependent receptor [Flavobacteriaceae bacterium]MCB9213819.1 TonB-dependent receptor [Alteromonas sp.]HPF11215.1 TonB-dependent receptor [Flavobacteriaceae bacterium]HQU21694.1 TonB-dependent receptor [Flavobacteriaceae bacterium]HQU64566.1 TonB-dependent receptor [Flavobacteriaceae bacterium]
MSLYIKFAFFLLSVIPLSAYAQTTISGSVSQKDGTAVVGANIYLEGTYDGASSDEKGHFSFDTEESGIQTLVVSYVSFEPFYMAADVSQLKNLSIILKEDVNSLETVVISAGTFEAGDNSKVSVLKPLDVVTTASALGDFVGALQTLPGTTTVAEDGRLFVRGGDAGETQIFIDGIRVFTPYTPTTNNIPARGRYSPFLFDGITFSTGGYSAEYGQALSSVLLLNTIDEPVQEETNIALMSVGGGLGHTKKWEQSSLSFNASYINLAPYIAVFPDRNEWDKPFEAFGGETVFRRKFAKGLLKWYTAFDATNFELTQEDINLPQGFHFKLNNNNLYSNASYAGELGADWGLETGGSFTRSQNKFVADVNAIDDVEYSAHLKLKLKKRFSNRFKLYLGAEQFLTNFSEDFENPSISSATYGFNNNLTAVFVESDLIFSKLLAAKVGVRGEYSALFDQMTISPRFSLAYKTTKHSQLSLAYGDFYQQPLSDVLKFTDKLEARKTQHYILNYQYTRNDRILRAEVYHKAYRNLVTYAAAFPDFSTAFANDGEGYARGLDVFYRDNQSFKNVDYWVSYSFLDSERNYQNYPSKATPPFANSHNLSVVAKYWIGDWKSQVGMSYQFASGRTFTNPNQPGFLNDLTKSYNSLSVNWAYLISPQKILYFSVNNLPGFKNVNGYQYANVPNAQGIFDRRTLRPAADQFFFVGFFWTISEDGTKNQLDNL